MPVSYLLFLWTQHISNCTLHKVNVFFNYYVPDSMYKNTMSAMKHSVRDISMSSMTSHTYRVTSLSLHCLPQRWNNSLYFTCRVGIGQSDRLSLEPTKMSQSGDSSELIHSRGTKRQTDEDREILIIKKISVTYCLK